MGFDAYKTLPTINQYSKMLFDLLSELIVSNQESILAAQGMVELSNYVSPNKLLQQSREMIEVKLNYNIVLEEYRQLYVHRCKENRQRIKHFMRLRNVLYVCAVEKEVDYLMNYISKSDETRRDFMGKSEFVMAQ